jgi:hypothetical protein
MPMPVARWLFHHVGEQTEESRTLDGLSELALLFVRDGGDPARHNLAALGDKPL